MSSQRKTAIVTGASQRIGAGIVKAFVERGFNVVANSRKVTQSTEVVTNGGLETITQHLSGCTTLWDAEPRAARSGVRERPR